MGGEGVELSTAGVVELWGRKRDDTIVTELVATLPWLFVNTEKDTHGGHGYTL